MCCIDYRGIPKSQGRLIRRIIQSFTFGTHTYIMQFLDIGFCHIVWKQNQKAGSLFRDLFAKLLAVRFLKPRINNLNRDKVLIARSACGLDSPTTCCRYRVLIIGCAIKLGSTRQTAASERTPRRFERASSNCSHKSSMSFLPLVAANRYRKSRTVDS